jgi:hypothetical protein
LGGSKLVGIIAEDSALTGQEIALVGSSIGVGDLSLA